VRAQRLQVWLRADGLQQALAMLRVAAGQPPDLT
jgi:hypothetical protein